MASHGHGRTGVYQSIPSATPRTGVCLRHCVRVTSSNACSSPAADGGSRSDERRQRRGHMTAGGGIAWEGVDRGRGTERQAPGNSRLHHECLGERGYPPSVREIGEAVGLASSSTVHAHLAVLQREGYLKRDPTKPRAIEVRYDPASKAALPTGRVRQVPLVGDVAAGTGVLATENVTELLAVPEELTGGGSLFALRVRGDSMIEAGIFDGDLVVVAPAARRRERRRRGRGNPRRRGDGQAFLPAWRCNRSRSRKRAARADGVESRGCDRSTARSSR